MDGGCQTADVHQFELLHRLHARRARRFVAVGRNPLEDQVPARARPRLGNARQICDRARVLLVRRRIVERSNDLEDLTGTLFGRQRAEPLRLRNDVGIDAPDVFDDVADLVDRVGRRSAHSRQIPAHWKAGAKAFEVQQRERRACGCSQGGAQHEALHYGARLGLSGRSALDDDRPLRVQQRNDPRNLDALLARKHICFVELPDPSAAQRLRLGILRKPTPERAAPGSQAHRIALFETRQKSIVFGDGLIQLGGGSGCARLRGLAHLGRQDRGVGGQLGEFSALTLFGKVDLGELALVALPGGSELLLLLRRIFRADVARICSTCTRLGGLHLPEPPRDIHHHEEKNDLREG